MKLDSKCFKPEFPKCLYCQKYAMWEGDNVCFDKADPHIIDPRKHPDCKSFEVIKCQTKKACEALAQYHEAAYKDWLENEETL